MNGAEKHLVGRWGGGGYGGGRGRVKVGGGGGGGKPTPPQNPNHHCPTPSPPVNVQDGCGPASVDTRALFIRWGAAKNPHRNNRSVDFQPW